MKASPTMQQLAQQYGVDLTPVGAYLRLDLPDQDSLVLDHLARAQIAVTSCFEERGSSSLAMAIGSRLSSRNWRPAGTPVPSWMQQDSISCASTTATRSG